MASTVVPTETIRASAHSIVRSSVGRACDVVTTGLPSGDLFIVAAEFAGSTTLVNSKISDNVATHHLRGSVKNGKRRDRSGELVELGFTCFFFFFRAARSIVAFPVSFGAKPRPCVDPRFLGRLVEHAFFRIREIRPEWDGGRKIVHRLGIAVPASFAGPGRCRRDAAGPRRHLKDLRVEEKEERNGGKKRRRAREPKAAHDRSS